MTDKGEVLDSDAAANRGFDGLHGWMKKAEKIWNGNKRSEMKLVELFDYFAQLSSQFPTPSMRVVYAKAGTQPAACAIRGTKFIVENLAYWMAPVSENESCYVVGILNSE